MCFKVERARLRGGMLAGTGGWEEGYEMLSSGHDGVIAVRNKRQLWASARVIWKNGISSNERRKGKEDNGW